jgi:UDP-N-acetylmuramyl pentapeptide synthase
MYIDKITSDIDYFIVEMQTDGNGQIDRFCNVSIPDYSFLLNVNHTHILRFNTLENILNEKLAVYRNLKSEGKIFLNIDNDILKNWHLLQNDERTRTVGTNNSNAMYQYKNITQKNGLYQFDIINKINMKETPRVTTLLPGKQSILPIVYFYSLS